MAYCEIINKIENKTNLGKLGEPSTHTANVSNMTNSLVSEIVNEIVGEAVYNAEEKHKISDENKSEINHLKNNVGDVLTNNKKLTSDTHQCTPLEEEIKKAIADIQSQPVKPESSKGIGDQLSVPESESIIITKHPIVEKKSRLTDLVKNSKQILSKLIQNEKSKFDERIEEREEKILSVIELDCVENAHPFKAENNILPQNIPLPDEADDIFDELSEDILESVDFSNAKSTTLPQKRLSNSDILEKQKSMTFPVAASSSTSRQSVRSRLGTLRITPRDFRFKKPKWNLGSRFLNYIKNRNTTTPAEAEKDKQ